MELFNLKDDIGEHHNVANSNPKKVLELAKEMSDYFTDVDAQMPSDKITKKKVPLPIHIIKS